MPRNSHLKWQVIYEPGTLEAIGYKKGKKITSKIETTGTPYKVMLTTAKTILSADGKDATVCNVSIVDEKGREVPIADNRVQFSLSGNAKIIGVGNGDPSSHEPDKCREGSWQRSAFNGKCQVIILAGTTPETVTLEAKSNGLQSAAVNLQLQP
jgi:beta-galactosidase